MIPRPVRVALFAAACLAVLWLSLSRTSVVVVPGVTLWDKAEHAGAYLTLAILGAWALGGARWSLAVGLFAFGVGVEFAQATMGLGRDGDVLDAAANSLGIALGLGLARLIGERLMVKSPARGE